MDTHRIFIFVDNSNIFIEGQKEYGNSHFNRELGLRYRLDFGKLFEYIARSRGDIFFDTDSGKTFPKLYGSEPPKMDSLWKFLKNFGVDVQVFQRNAFNKEKEVDSALIWDAAELILTEAKKEGDIIAIAGGDKDFLKINTKGQEKGYEVEYYCWYHSACHEIKHLENFHNLTAVIDKIGFVEKDRFEHNYGEVNWGKVVPYSGIPTKEFKLK
jgi:uncharacterized LabA/DUF88 family protein